jgi:polar amino acid transport system substrate-binding protein
MLLVLGAIGWGAAAETARGATPEVERVRARLAGNVLKWGGDAEGGAPFQFYDPGSPDKMLGFEVDLVDALIEKLSTRLEMPSLKAEYVQYDWISLPQGLQKKDFDIIVSGIEITRENTAKFRLTRPYYLFGQQLTVRADETRIKSVADAKHSPVGTLSDTAAHRWLAHAGVKSITTYKGQVEPYLDLANGRVDAVLLDLPIAVYHAGEDKRLKFVGAPEGWSGYGIGARNEDADLVEMLNVALGELYREGKHEEIYRRWKMWNGEQQALAEVDSVEKLFTWAAAKNGGVEVHFEAWTFRRYFPLLLYAAGTTIALSIVSMALAMLIGLFVALARLYGPAPLRWAALAYVEFFRGTPLLLLLTFLYFGLPNVPYVGFSLTAWQAAIIGFGLNYAAFEAEIYRSSILAVPRGQWEAAHALGMDNVTTFRRVIFPQAIRTALGPMTNDFVAMFKDTSLVSVISIVELTKQYDIIARSSNMFVTIGALTALLYLAMSVPLGYLARYLEDKWSAGHK